MPLLQKSLAGQKIAAYVKIARQSEKFWNASVIAVATFLLLSTFPLFPLVLTAALSLACGFIATKRPPVAMIINGLLGLLAVSYQAPALGLLYLLFLALLMFEVFENWLLIAAAEIIVFAPFAMGSVPFMFVLSAFVLSASALYMGSKKSLFLSVPAVYIMLLLSSAWLAPVSSLPLYMLQYQPQEALITPATAAPGFSEVPGAIGEAVGNLFSLETMNNLGTVLATIADRTIKMLLMDSGFLQVAGWASVLFLMSLFAGRLKKRAQLVSSLLLLLLVPVYYLSTLISETVFGIEFPAAIIVSVILLGMMEQFGINIAREAAIGREERMKAYGKFGMADLGIRGEETLADVGGYGDVKQELNDAIIMPLEKKEIAYAYGIRPPSGILLFGPPGTGKTMLMRALAKELRYNFIEVRCSQILSQWYGESEKNLAEVFSKARKNAPTILFFDEIDAIGKKRSSESLDEVGPRVLTTMLQEMDGATKSKANVIVIGATNIPSELDRALLRPGRFDKIIYMSLPDAEARKSIFKVSMRGIPLDEDIDLDLLVRKTRRFSGADIKNIVVEAKRLAAKEATEKGEVVPIGMKHLLDVVEGIKPSTSLAQLDSYERFKLDFERRIGKRERKEEKKKVKGVRWVDVAGLGEIKKAFLEAIELPLLHEEEMKEIGVLPSKGILLFGPPGTGKTLIVKAAANELKASFQSVSGADIMKKGYMRAVEVVREVFNRGRENTPAIIFVDEIETFAPARGRGVGTEIVGQFLTEMDGMKASRGVVVVGATNRPSILDTAILRPGRFDKIFYVPPPDADGRVEIFRIHLGKFAKGADLKALAAKTKGFTGADIAAICQAAKMDALRQKIEGKKPVVNTDMLLKIIAKRRPSVTRTMLSEYKEFLEAYGERR